MKEKAKKKTVHEEQHTITIVATENEAVVCAIKKWVCFVGSMWNTTTKISRKVISVLGVVILLLLLVGCNESESDIEINLIETPSAIRHFVWSPVGHPDNLAHYQLGAVRDSGEIIDITDIGAMMSYPIGDQTPMLDLSGTALSIDLDVQYGYGLLGDNFHETLAILSVLEFTFPEATHPDGTEIYWYVDPHLICSYEIHESTIIIGPGIDETEPVTITNLPSLWIDSAALEDTIGYYDLIHTPEPMMINAINSRFASPQDYFFEGETSGKVASFNNERSGTMIVPKGSKAKLFLGVSIMLVTNEQGDRIQIGGDSLPATVSVSDRCTLRFGNDSYYTIRPATN